MTHHHQIDPDKGVALVVMEDVNQLPLVVVTGATGFVAGHIISQLLVLGNFRVRGTTRNPNDTKKLEHLTGTNNHLLSFVKAELDDPEACIRACEGATFLIHAASPYVLAVKDVQKELMEPAVHGALNFLRAANAKGIKRVVMTSSMAAITDGPRTGHVFTEADWNERFIKFTTI
jgi:dihydroflavonol-4-reductase